MTYIGVEEEKPSVPASNGLILALGRHVRRRMAACDPLGPFRAGLRSTDNWGAGQPERRAAFVNAKERGVVGGSCGLKAIQKVPRSQGPDSNDPSPQPFSEPS
jgi:hypothetical protein